AERQALIEAGCPEPPPIDEGALWTRFAGGRKRGRIYAMGVVPSHQHPPLFPDDEDADTASAPDLRERVVMLNREISQQAEANARRVAALESTVQSQSQEVSDLRKAYADVYNLLTQMRSGGSSSATLAGYRLATHESGSIWVSREANRLAHEAAKQVAASALGPSWTTNVPPHPSAT
ncbi:hypothetical protein PIB30_085831, partial [Stylosanthes scabra]|nr:hypothetical protein [Stylosanthes scabra]